MDGLGETEAELRRSLNDVDEFGFPHYGTYEYATDNPFVKHETPFAEGMRLLENNGSLTDAALLLEVATQRDAEHEDEEIHRSNSERSRAGRRARAGRGAAPARRRGRRPRVPLQSVVP